MRRTGRQYRRVRLPGWRRLLLLLGVLAVVAVPVTATLFLHGSRTTVLAGHDAVVRPSLDGYATLDLGPYLPELPLPERRHRRRPHRPRQDHGRLLHRADPALRVHRQPARGADPQGPRRDDRPGPGQRRRRRADRAGRARRVVLLVGAGAGPSCAARRDGTAYGRRSLAVVLVAAVAGRRPALGRRRRARSSRTPGSRWPTPSPSVTVPERGPTAADRVRADHQRHPPAGGRARWTPTGAARLLQPARRRGADELAGQLHQPRRGERSGCWSATGTTTSAWTRWPARSPTRAARRSCSTPATTPRPASAWEAFSLESLDDAFDDYDARFVDRRQPRQRRLRDQAGRPSSASPPSTARSSTVPAACGCSGSSDPRSSGLGTWRDERGHLLRGAGAAARRPRLPARRRRRPDRHAAGARRRTAARQALARGCVDLVLAGHLHEQVGPDPGHRSRTARSATPTPTARPAARRTPWRSAASCAATPR